MESTATTNKYYDLGVSLRRSLTAARQFAKTTGSELKTELSELKAEAKIAYSGVKAGYKA